MTEVNPTTNVVGTAVTYAREDHEHFHGELPGGLLHEVVNFDESGDPGFMSMEDYTKLQGIADNATNTPIEGDAIPLDVSATAGSPGVSTTSASASDHQHFHGNLTGADLHVELATWDVTKCRYFFLDNNSGDDAHAGFLDRDPGHSFGGGEAAAVAAAKIKTVERLLEILPRNGNGRMAKILFKNRSGGSTYRMADGTTYADLDLTGIHGYRWLGRCGSTDLSNTTNDMTQAGGIVSRAGPNGDESFTVATIGGGVITIASGSFGTDADQQGLRIRFKGNVTPDVENFCFALYRVNSTSSLRYVVSALTPTPAVGDDFFIERVGVTFANVYDISSATTMSVEFEDPDLGPLDIEMASPMVGIQAQADDDGGSRDLPLRLRGQNRLQLHVCEVRRRRADRPGLLERGHRPHGVFERLSRRDRPALGLGSLQPRQRGGLQGAGDRSRIGWPLCPDRCIRSQCCLQGGIRLGRERLPIQIWGPARAQGRRLQSDRRRKPNDPGALRRGLEPRRGLLGPHRVGIGGVRRNDHRQHREQHRLRV